MEKAKAKKIGKVISNIVSGVLLVLIALVLVCTVTMMFSKNSNYGVPSLFGRSFMYVATDSMVGDRPDSLSVGTGIIAQQTAVEDIQPDDILTFYNNELEFPDGSSGGVVSHRVKEIQITPTTAEGEAYLYISKEETYSIDNRLTWSQGGEKITVSNGKEVLIKTVQDEVFSLRPRYLPSTPGAAIFYATGDNLSPWNHPEGVSSTYRDIVGSSSIIGKVVFHNDALGGFLQVLVSAWFVPVMVLVPISLVAVLSGVDLIKKSKEDQKAEKEELHNRLVVAGVDPGDEAACLLFEEKERAKIDIAKEIEEAKAEEKKRLLKEIKKEEKKAKKDKKGKSNGK